LLIKSKEAESNLSTCFYPVGGQKNAENACPSGSGGRKNLRRTIASLLIISVNTENEKMPKKMRKSGKRYRLVASHLGIIAFH